MSLALAIGVFSTLTRTRRDAIGSARGTQTGEYASFTGSTSTGTDTSADGDETVIESTLKYR